MWTNENRGGYDRSRLRNPSDLTDDEWILVDSLIPSGKRGGDKRTVTMRECGERRGRSHATPAVGMLFQIVEIRFAQFPGLFNAIY
jgi:hypothetical protein